MSVTTNVYPRAFSIHIDYPLNGTASCTFQQEIVAEINGETIRQPVGELRVIYDPSNDTMLQVYSLLRAFYLNLIGLTEEGAPVEEIPEPEAPAPEEPTEEQA